MPATLSPSIAFAVKVRERVAEAVVGQHVTIERLLISLLAGGHLLLQGVPGLAKTLLVNAVAKAIDLRHARIQFTIDLLPADIVGAEVLDRDTGRFRVRQGPVFTNLLLADEINRASPKVQSALLEAMQERRVTIADSTTALPAPFVVVATQNPIESAGTFELPEAQLDRFLLCHRLKYPERDEELEILQRGLRLGLRREGDGAMQRTAFDVVAGSAPVGSLAELTAAMAAVQAVHVSPVFLDHVVELVRRTRAELAFEVAASPRAGLALVHACRARALLHERDHVVPEDLFALAEDAVLHRLRLSYDALAEGRSGAQVLRGVVENLG